MKTIWKFPIKITDRQTLTMPKDAAIVSVDVQNDTPCVWAIVDDSQQTRQRTFEIYGTGHRIPEDSDQEGRMYVGTFQQFPFVWHLFERYVPIDSQVIAFDANSREQANGN